MSDRAHSTVEGTSSKKKPERAFSRKTAKLIELSNNHERLVERLNALEASLGDKVVPLAHIVSPARNMLDAKRGTPAASMCGEMVSTAPQEGAAVCRKCFELNRVRMETEAGEWMKKARAEGVAEGEAAGATRSMTAIREAAEQRATELAAAS